jgi:hypothetical protein
MADLTIVNTSICLATFVIFVGSELVLGLIPRVVILRLRLKAKSNELRLFSQKCETSIDFKKKSAVASVGCPPRNLTTKGTFAAIISKAVVVAMTIVSNTAVRALVR